MRDILGKGEFVILAALAKRPMGAHGTLLINDLRGTTGRDYSVGALYTTLERLQAKGFVSSSWGEPTAIRGGRRKKIFRVEAAGQRALQRTVDVVNSAYAPSSLKPLEA